MSNYININIIYLSIYLSLSLSLYIYIYVYIIGGIRMGVSFRNAYDCGLRQGGRSSCALQVVRALSGKG